jgi:hypothetical protein
MLNWPQTTSPLDTIIDVTKRRISKECRRTGGPHHGKAPRNYLDRERELSLLRSLLDALPEGKTPRIIVDSCVSHDGTLKMEPRCNVGSKTEQLSGTGANNTLRTEAVGTLTERRR